MISIKIIACNRKITMVSHDSQRITGVAHVNYDTAFISEL